MTFGLHENSSQPVGLILGIEADTDEESDSFWRMGYTYPVQLTQWVIASAPNHVVMTKFLQDFRMQMKNLISQAVVLNGVDPLELTGPAAITKATKDYLTEKAGLRWHALSGLKDGGRSKLVLDILILPITGFRYVVRWSDTYNLMRSMQLTLATQSWTGILWKHGLETLLASRRSCSTRRTGVVEEV